MSGDEEDEEEEKDKEKEQAPANAPVNNTPNSNSTTTAGSNSSVDASVRGALGEIAMAGVAAGGGVAAAAPATPNDVRTANRLVTSRSASQSKNAVSQQNIGMEGIMNVMLMLMNSAQQRQMLMEQREDDRMTGELARMSRRLDYKSARQRNRKTNFGKKELSKEDKKSVGTSFKCIEK